METKTFPAHTVLLSARSPVFKPYLPKITILFVEGCCTWTLWKICNGKPLWRYLLLLRTLRKYSFFLKDNRNVKNVCEVLRFLDLHLDKDLKKAAHI
ncbi:hypothetical protein TNIN_231171 [Trichonephila inaurata madagascariensis]|uniref:Uncharacterized protein n=1 Tax=Trichonephila inaurata madagascariensis TaxID=2747483 RepID=A0A8X6XXM0_9ARAC|nr:hypothetical protein TNIN_231171 [Trichonephila inaurata madagascariensis]